MRKELKKLLMIIILLIGVSGCGRQADSLLADTICSEFQEWNEESLIYSETVALVGIYLDDDTVENLSNMETELKQQEEHFQEKIDSFQVPDVTEELEKELRKHDLTKEDYLSLYDVWLDDLCNFVGRLELYQNYVEREKTSNMQREELRALYESDIRMMDYTARFEYVSLNYFLAELNDSQMEYVRETYLAEMEWYSFEDMGWSADRDELELRMEVYLNRIMEESKIWAEKSGRALEEIYGY